MTPYRPKFRDPWRSNNPDFFLKEAMRRDRNPDRSMFGAVSTAQYVRPQGLGLHVVKVNGVEVDAASIPGNFGFTENSRVTVANTLQGLVILGTPAAGERRRADNPSDSSVFDVSPIRIDTANPSELPIGETTEVAITGHNFFEEMQVRAVDAREDGSVFEYADAQVSIVSVASTESATLSVVLDGGASAGDRWGLEATK